VYIVLSTIVSVHFPEAVVTVVVTSPAAVETVVVSDSDAVVVVVVSDSDAVVVVSVGVVVVVSGTVGISGMVVVVVIWVNEMLVVVSDKVGTLFESIFSQAESPIAVDNAIAVKILNFLPKRIIF
jgi:hypothetical protein